MIVAMNVAPNVDIREAPTEAWIAEVRHRFHVEPTVDQELTAKLRNRSQPVTPLAGLPDIQRRLTRFLEATLDREFKLHNLAYLTGGASKEQFVFELEYHDGTAQTRDKLVLRRDPYEAITATYRQREFQLLRAFEGIVPVPTALWLDQAGEFFGRSSLICRFVTGVQKPRSISGNVTGLGILFPVGTRQRIAEEFVGALARIHTADTRNADLSAFHRPTGTTQAVEMHIDWWARVWFEDRLEEVPLMTVAEHWLRRHMPALDVVSLVHGDYRSGNFLFDEATCKITAILDWELAHFGDRHCDLTWIIFEAFLMRDEQDQMLCCGMLPRGEMIALYKAKSGLSVDEDKLHYYEIFMLWKAVIIVLASAPRVGLGQRTHHDILVNWLAGIGYVLMDSLRQKLREVI